MLVLLHNVLTFPLLSMALKFLGCFVLFFFLLSLQTFLLCCCFCHPWFCHQHFRYIYMLLMISFIFQVLNILFVKIISKSCLYLNPNLAFFLSASSLSANNPQIIPPNASVWLCHSCSKYLQATPYHCAERYILFHPHNTAMCSVLHTRKLGLELK